MAKSRFPRSVPVPPEAVTLYADYTHERHVRLGERDGNPLVFVNLYLPSLGRRRVLPECHGIHIAVAVAWQRASSGDWTNYAAEVSRRS